MLFLLLHLFSFPFFALSFFLPLSFCILLGTYFLCMPSAQLFVLSPFSSLTRSRSKSFCSASSLPRNRSGLLHIALSVELYDSIRFFNFAFPLLPFSFLSFPFTFLPLLSCFSHLSGFEVSLRFTKLFLLSECSTPYGAGMGKPSLTRFWIVWALFIYDKCDVDK